MSQLFRVCFVLVFSLTAFSCSAVEQSSGSQQMNGIAEYYVKLVLEIGLYDSDYVDAYYGPEEWRPAETDKVETFPYAAFMAKVMVLAQQLNAVKLSGLDALEQKRHAFMGNQLRAVQTHVERLNGKKFTFDEESALLYDAVAPTHEAAYFEDLRKTFEAALPGNGSISERLSDFKKDFIIPKEKLDAVFTAAIAECRKRTLQYVDLPENENFTVEYVTDKAWSAYNWYKGNSFSLIQVNTDFPIYIDRAIDLAAHEGYPGHHVFNALLEKHLSRERGWLEFSVYPLFSPQSLLAEGSANYGIQMVFPGEERVAFERKILAPLAGIEPDMIEKYYKVLELTEALGYAGNEAARNYLDGKISAEEAADWLVRYSLMTPERAKQRLRFIEKYRSYVINYNLGQEIVKDYIESNGGTVNNPEKRWRLFTELLSTPVRPSALVEATKKVSLSN